MPFLLRLYFECNNIQKPPLFFQETMQATGEKNIIISPMSLWTLASLMSEGATGDTLSEMTKTLKHLDKNGTRDAYNLIDRAISEKSKLVQLDINNNIFMTKNIQVTQLKFILYYKFNYKFIKVNWFSLKI